MNTLPFYVYFVFGVTLLATIYFFYKATKSSRSGLILIIFWIIFQSVLGLSGFYLRTDIIPPRFPLIIFPPIILIIMLFITKKGRQFIDSLDIKILTLLHIIRIPIELVLFWLFIHKAVPQLMTFEGRNFDIFSGITAPIIYYFGFIKNKLALPTIIAWNFICLALVINVAVNGLLSAPTPLQRLAFEQPNIAIQYFPFILLPSVVVPLVIFSHFVSIKQLIAKIKNHNLNNDSYPSPPEM